jgi:hypothetical protein
MVSGSDLACIKRHHVLAVRVVRWIYGQWEEVWDTSKDITYYL